MEETLKATAYHEAGHAIISNKFGKPFEYVTIIEKDEALGHVRFCFDRSRIIDLIEGVSDEYLEIDEIDKIVEEEIIINLSGYTAELKLGINNPAGASSDLDNCNDLITTHCGDLESSNEFFE